ncbi:MAG: hypothetical protein COC22_00570 [Flavobacteriaceae bacterium]|nr:MAG: hypothetical protein COC22_00570 [Flavobacteriaceae bacterium]
MLESRLQSYDKMKDSGVAWLGDIPEGWELKKLKRVLVFSTGGTPSSHVMGYYDGDEPWVTIADLSGKYTSKFHTISKLGVKAASIPLVKTGSLLFSFKLSVGQVAFAHQDLYTNEAIASFEPLQSAHLNYWYYAMSLFLIKNAATNIYGAYILNQNLIKNAQLLAPPLPEQKAIADFLDKKTRLIDQAVTVKEQQIALLKERKQILIQKAVTQGLNPTAPKRDSGVEWIGKIPKHWKVKRLKFLMTYFKGFAFKSEDFSDEGIRIVKASNIKRLQVSGNFSHISYSNQKSEFDRFKLKTGDVIISTVGSKPDIIESAVGQLCSIDKNNNGSYLNQNTVCIRPNNLFNKDFLKFTFASKYMRANLDKNALWIANQAYLEIDEILKSEVTLPQISEQTAIVAYIEKESIKIDQAIDLSGQQIDKLKEYKATLINSAVTGKIKVV